MNFYTFLTTFVLGLLGVGQLHEYLVSGKVPTNFNEAPKVLRDIVESHDRANARKIMEAAIYANAAGQYAVIEGNLTRTVERLTDRVARDRFDTSPVHVSVLGLTDSEVLRAQRFLELRGTNLHLLDEPNDSVESSSASISTIVTRNRRIAVSRELKPRLEVSQVGFASLPGPSRS